MKFCPKIWNYLLQGNFACRQARTTDFVAGVWKSFHGIRDQANAKRTMKWFKQCRAGLFLEMVSPEEGVLSFFKGLFKKTPICEKNYAEY